MAHWAELDENNIVLRVTVGNNDDPAGDEGYNWLIENLGGTWVKTSYNATIRKNFAGVGYRYDKELDAFIAPQPYASWTFDLETFTWLPPIPRPEIGIYEWNEKDREWNNLNV